MAGDCGGVGVRRYRLLVLLILLVAVSAWAILPAIVAVSRVVAPVVVGTALDVVAHQAVRQVDGKMAIIPAKHRVASNDLVSHIRGNRSWGGVAALIAALGLSIVADQLMTPDVAEPKFNNQYCGTGARSVIKGCMEAWAIQHCSDIGYGACTQTCEHNGGGTPCGAPATQTSTFYILAKAPNGTWYGGGGAASYQGSNVTEPGHVATDAEIWDLVQQHLADVPAALESPQGYPGSVVTNSPISEYVRLSEDQAQQIIDELNGIATATDALAHEIAQIYARYGMVPDSVIRSELEADPTSVILPNEDALTSSTQEPQQLELPAPCDWFPELCTWLTWTQDETGFPDNPTVPVEAPTEQTWDSGLGAGQCPAPTEIVLAGTAVSISWDVACDGAVMLSWLVLASASIAAAFILLGVRN